VAEFLSSYGLFLLELVTIVGVVLVAVVIAQSLSRRAVQADGIQIEHLNKQFDRVEQQMQRVLLGRDLFRRSRKLKRKADKRARRARKSESATKPRIFVLDFKGDIRASATASLRREVSAILGVASDADKVLLRLENAGGAVHEHGLAASQLLRLKARGIELAVAVDKVAASGGYLMACVADRLMSAPFAIIGSIGVIAQLPNFHRWLESRGVDFEQLTAGAYKRTITVFGENTEQGRRKLQEEIADVHELFKAQIAEHRPKVDIERVSTGEHWYGIRAIELDLVDEIRTSDDFLIEAARDADLYHVRYKRRRTAVERLISGVETLLSR
jgi:serine protease SohB